MEQQMISAKQQDRFDREAQQREFFVRSLNQMMEAQRENYNGYAYSAGWLQSMLTQVWMQLPKAKRERVLEDVKEQTIKQLKEVVDKARV
jgi:hypothetical protein